MENNTELVPTSRFPGLKLKFPFMNPFQSAFVPLHDKDINVVCAARTGAGKSLIAELAFYNKVCNEGKKVIYLAPMRSLVKEKYDDWTKEDHALNDCGVMMVTGEYRLTKERQDEINLAHTIIMTSEMLDSRTRRMNVENNAWLLKVGTIVVDEAHVIGMFNDDKEPLEERGHKLEAALIRFTKINKNAQIILLSATLPNIPELGGWLTKLNNKPTETIVSNYIPQPLNWNLETYDEAKWGPGSYNINKHKAKNKIVDLIKDNPDDMFCVFVHAKTDGKMMQKALTEELGIEIPFHSADLDKEDRIEIETDFKGRKLPGVVATSTLAYGMNMPARRVYILDSKRGLNRVHPYDIKQMGGRAGRPGIDPQGDVHWIVPNSEARNAQYTIDNMPDAKSQMFNIDVFSFHIVAEIAEGEITRKEQVFEYYKRSLAAHQGQSVDESWFISLVNQLIKCEILKQDKDGNLYCTALGKISSMMYFSPFDIYNWANNLRKCVNEGRKDDYSLAWMLGAIRSNKMTYVPKDCQPYFDQIVPKIRDLNWQGYELAIMSYYYQMKGEQKIPATMYGKIRQITFDMERHEQALQMIDSMYLKLDKGDSLKLLSTRVKYGCNWECAKLCLLPGIGAAKSKLLIDNGVENLQDLLKKKDLGIQLLGRKTYAKATGTEEESD